MEISSGTTLCRVPELVVDLNSASEVRVHHRSSVWQFGHHAMALLDAFRQPSTVAAGMRALAPRLRGERAVHEALNTLSEMVAAGILCTELPQGFTDLMYPVGGYGLAYANIRMLDDPLRKALFVKAVSEVVRPDDVVLDLGTGSGILAVAAAQAGARVHAVEPARTVEVARRMAKHNGVADRITFIQGWSTTLTLPEKATVLTTDIVGNEALDMVIWETIQDARRRLLTPDARLVPESLTAYGYLSEIPADRVAEHRVVPAHIEEWNARYGMDFSPLLELDRHRVAGFYEPPSLVRQWRRLSEPVPLYEVDLRQDARVFRNTTKLTVNAAGGASGLVVYFDARLSPKVRLSTDPANGDARSHWYTAGWAFPEGIPSVPGTQVSVSYVYEGDGRARVEAARVGEVNAA